MLYVHGKQLWSCRDGQLTYPHCSWASLPEAGNQYLAHIISPLTDKCSSWELGSNYLLISRDFKICIVIRAIYFKVFALANR